MFFHVFFKLDGIQGRETFEVSASLSERILSSYQEALDQFWDLVLREGARTVEPITAWQQVQFVSGPTVLSIQMVQ